MRRGFLLDWRAVAFVRAQTIAFAEFISCKGEAGARQAARMRAESKEYPVKDGDVLNFLFNV